MNELLSHARPKKRLSQHLINVAERSKEKVQSMNLNTKLISKKEVADLTYILGALHDLGKLDKTFQDFIWDVEKQGHSNKKHNNHAEVSARISALFIKEYLEKSEIDEDLAKVLSLSLPHLIQRHHGCLGDPLDYANSDTEVLEAQLEEFSKEKDRLFKLFQDTCLAPYVSSLSDILRKINRDLCDEEERFHLQNEALAFLEKLSSEDRIELFLLHELLFSNLVDYDKKDAARILDFKAKTIDFPDILIDKYKDDKKLRDPINWGPSKENLAKEEFYHGVVDNPDLTVSNRRYTITAPTGAGKTLTALSAAFRLRKRVASIQPLPPRIIYVLPYTSIIDQNYLEFKKVLQFGFGGDFERNEPDYLLRHHHLSEHDLRHKETGMPLDYLTQMLWIGSWESNIVVSTYIQLLYSLIGCHGNFLNKFHNIVNSIIIMDEVQFVGSEYWHLIKDVIGVLSERFGTYFILMTATQPHILEGAVELVTNRPRIWSEPKINTSSQPGMSLEDFKQFFVEKLFESNPKRNLLIFNTVKSSIEFYDFLRKMKNESRDFDFDLYYLSTNILYNDRKKRIENLKKLNRKLDSSYICVTTQIVEAGVDLSSDFCFRDASPMDCVVQSAGRCNRFRELGDTPGEFLVRPLKNDADKCFFRYIYDPSLVMETLKQLEDVENSVDFEMAVDSYFRKLENYKHSSVPKYISALNFQKVCDNFNLIQEMPKKRVYLVQNDEAEKLLSEYLHLFAGDWTEGKFELIGDLKKIKTKMQRYFAEINYKTYEEMKKRGYIQPEQYGLEFVKKEDFTKVYDDETGIIHNFSDEAIFLGEYDG